MRRTGIPSLDPCVSTVTLSTEAEKQQWQLLQLILKVLQ